MSAVGPELPPHLLAKRKRRQDEETTDRDSAGPGAKRAKSPQQEKKTQQIGPAPPPAPLDERPSVPAVTGDNDDESSDDDDDFGPLLPTSTDSAHSGSVPEAGLRVSSRPKDEQDKSSSAPRRDDWMLVPPKQDDLAARQDPSKIRARGFNTGKGAKGPAGPGGDNDTWTETPEQKRKRLADQVLGIKTTSDPTKSDKREEAKRREEKERAAKIKESRGKSLYDMHQSRDDKEEEDDPSARAFDREKDMSTGMKLGNTQKKELLNKASDFGSKFSSGSFL